MTKRMIDADALKAWIVKQLEISNYAIDSCDSNFKLKDTHNGCKIILDALVEKINELSTPAPVAQEGDGWCYDMFKAPQEFTILIEGDYGYAILHEVSWHNHDACPSTPEAFEHNLKCLADGYHKTGKIVAWRPQPPIPTMGDL